MYPDIWQKTELNLEFTSIYTYIYTSVYNLQAYISTV